MHSKSTITQGSVDLVTFHLGDSACGLDIMDVQEITGMRQLTMIPQAPRHVRGILNLRGQVVTIIDLQDRLGLGPAQTTQASRIIIIRSQGEKIGLLVDSVGDVHATERTRWESPPVNMQGIQGSFFLGVDKHERGLTGILDLGQVLLATDQA